ncbi:acetoacetate--CoA ligase [Zhengella mangrovi]|uniref:Acetoacetate--CoA ligase n=1 Tax=Zhengella mangrovi TaxID=1982044 RepID=A0A2G1QSB4_9HYPH|nr:acetoacetate--CoA ligase [Zhengella mangrovi]PHP68382.1 acetoacetate--CoA ligase [Zhengella mangrovi]
MTAPRVVKEGEILWEASAQRREAAEITAFMTWLKGRGHAFDTYMDLWKWSVEDIAGFWQAVWDWFEIIHDGGIESVVTDDPMPRTRWFTGTRLNYAEHVLRHEGEAADGEIMIDHSSELREPASMTWAEVGAAVRKLATRFRAMGLEPGDRVVAYMPNLPETVIAMLAATAIGATWSSAAPEFGAQTVIDRFSQIEPKLVLAVNGYRYGGKDYDRTGDLEKILSRLPTAETLVVLDYLPGAGRPAFASTTLGWDDMMDGPEVARDAFEFTRVASDHPLWVLFSSGTTGLPKPIVQGHHGIVVEHCKSAAFHLDVPRGGAYFCYSTTGWMVWNTLMIGPLMRGRAVLYDGHPTWPDAGALWRIMERSRVTSFGVSPTFMQIVRAQGVRPREDFDITSLKSMFLTGSPSTPEILAWIQDAVGADLYATSQSGGTEVCSGLLAGSVLLPARAGEIQCPALGCDAAAFDEDGRPVVGEVGELVVRKPMPSMPLFFWGDEDFARYTDSYFDVYPGIWRHGDRVRFTETGGSYVLGRSDATLNRFGVRIGSAEIYRTIETFPEIAESLIVCIEEEGGGYYMPLFLQMAPGKAFSGDLQKEIVRRLRSERSPRHVPDEIVVAPEIPMTLTGKKMEVPVRKLLLGERLHKVASKDATRNPAALDWFADFASARRNRG